MRKIAYLATILLVGGTFAGAAAAQNEPAADDKEGFFPRTSSEVEMTPEMLFYREEYRRYQSEAVRRKAEERSRQRQNRLAARRWFGLSNLRPQANPIPYYGSYSPSWVSNSSLNYNWAGFGGPLVFYHLAGARE